MQEAIKPFIKLINELDKPATLPETDFNSLSIEEFKKEMAEEQRNNIRSGARYLQRNIANLANENLLLFNPPKSREEIIKEKSKMAVEKASADTQDFDDQYEKPLECYDLKDSQTRVKCANAYMQARTEFNKKNMSASR
jgi:hypothetical protein